MTEMRLTFSEENGVMRFELGGDQSRIGAITTLRDTANGVEVRTILRDADGTERTLVDMVDRGTPPLTLMLDVWGQFERSFIANVQGAFNKSRYDRLKEEGKPINQQTMCMCGQHTDDKYAEMPFGGGIVGVPDAPVETGPTGLPEPTQSAMTQEDQDKVRALLDWMPGDEEAA